MCDDAKSVIPAVQFDEDDEEGSVIDQDSYNIANMSSVSCLTASDSA